MVLAVKSGPKTFVSLPYLSSPDPSRGLAAGRYGRQDNTARDVDFITQRSQSHPFTLQTQRTLLLV